MVYDRAGRLLLIRRGRAPGRGRWSLPGGRVESGESDHQAVRRELAEETGLLVSAGRLVGTARRPAGDGRVYEIFDYRCEPIGGTLRAGDDAADARWCDLATFRSLDLVDELAETLAEWHCLPSSGGAG